MERTVPSPKRGGTVDPIRDLDKIARIKAHLRRTSPRDYLLFTVGINSALRVSDLLRLKVGDLIDDEGNVKENIVIRQKKTRKEVRPAINDSMIEAIQHWRKDNPGPHDPDAHLFSTTRGPTRNGDRPMSSVALWQAIKRWADAAGLKGNYGTHSLRKTWGYQARMQGIGIETIMHKLGQQTVTATKAYLGITQDEINDIERRVNL